MTVKKRKRGGMRCIAALCSNTYQEAVSLFRFPWDEILAELCPKEKRKTRSWLDIIFKTQYPMQQPLWTQLLRTGPSAFCRKLGRNWEPQATKEPVKTWTHGCRVCTTRLYRAASSTPAGIGELIADKWHSGKLHICETSTQTLYCTCYCITFRNSRSTLTLS